MLCHALPYEGTDPFIFFSYSHKDEETAYPILDQLVKSGYRIWYDEGIHPGANWPEVIASHLSQSSACLALFSANSAESHNCKNEINQIMMNKKPLIILQLGDFPMTVSMRLQLASVPVIRLCDIPSETALLDKICAEEVLQTCRTLPRSLPVRKNTVSEQKPQHAASLNACLSNSPVDHSDYRQNEMNQDKGNKPERQTADRFDLQPGKHMDSNHINNRSWIPSASTAENTVLDRDADETVYDFHPDEDTVLDIKPESQCLLLHLPSRTGYIVHTYPARMGRSKKCEIALSDNHSVSAQHAEIFLNNDTFFLKDTDSTNGTFLGNQKLSSGDALSLTTPCIFRLYNEPFIFISGEYAQALLHSGFVGFLVNQSSCAMRLLTAKPLPLNRNEFWEDDTLLDKKISRTHAEAYRSGNQFFIKDLDSKNGTHLTRRNTHTEIHLKNKIYELSDGDQLRLGSTILEFGLIRLHKENII